MFINKNKIYFHRFKAIKTIEFMTAESQYETNTQLDFKFT